MKRNTKVVSNNITWEPLSPTWKPLDIDWRPLDIEWRPLDIDWFLLKRTKKYKT